MLARFHAHQMTNEFNEIRNEFGNFHISDAGDKVFEKYWTMLAALDPGKSSNDVGFAMLLVQSASDR